MLLLGHGTDEGREGRDGGSQERRRYSEKVPAHDRFSPRSGDPGLALIEL